MLYLLRGLLNTLQKREWDPNLDYKALIFFNVLNTLCAAGQEVYCYHIDKGMCPVKTALPVSSTAAVCALLGQPFRLRLPPQYVSC